MLQTSTFARTEPQDSGYSMMCRQPFDDDGGARDEVQQALVDLARVRQHNHVGERLVLAKAAAGGAFFHRVVSRMALPSARCRRSSLAPMPSRANSFGSAMAMERRARQQAARRGAPT